MKDRQFIGKWSSQEGREKYVEAYNKAMQVIPKVESLRVKTSFGKVQVYCWENRGSNHKTPILLIPRRSSGTPMWYANIPDFYKNRTVYALDNLGDAGLSEQEHPIKTATDQAKWIAETIEELNLPKVHIIGHFFGG